MVINKRSGKDLRKLSGLKQKDRIQILLSEYAALRAEIMNRTGFGFQIAAVSLAGITWLMQQQLHNQPWYFWLIMAGVAGCFVIAIFVNVRDLTRAAYRIKELEHEVNSRAGEHLLVWETLSGVVTRMSVTKSFFSTIKSFPRSELPPLNESLSSIRRRLNFGYVCHLSSLGPSRSLGLRTDFPFSRLNEWAAKGMRLVERRVIKPYGFFTLVRFRRQEQAAAGRMLERRGTGLPLNQHVKRR